MDIGDGRSFFVENQMEVSIKKGPIPKVTFKFNVNPKIMECNRNEVDFIVNSILQEQNMTLDDFKNELDSKLEKVLTMKYYLTKLYKGGSPVVASLNAVKGEVSDASSTTSTASGSGSTTTEGSSTSSSSSSDALVGAPSSTNCGLHPTENSDSTFSWKCCCCTFASTGKNLKSTRESYRKHHKNWHSPEGIQAQQQAAALLSGENGQLPILGPDGLPLCGPIPKKRKPSLGSASRKTKIPNIPGLTSQQQTPGVLIGNGMFMPPNGFQAYNPLANGASINMFMNGSGSLSLPDQHVYGQADNNTNSNSSNNNNINVMNVDELLVANANALNMHTSLPALSDADMNAAAINLHLVDVSVSEDDFSSLFDD